MTVVAWSALFNLALDNREEQDFCPTVSTFPFHPVFRHIFNLGKKKNIYIKKRGTWVEISPNSLKCIDESKMWRNKMETGEYIMTYMNIWLKIWKQM